MSNDQFDGGAGILGWAALAGLAFVVVLVTAESWAPLFAVLVL